MPTDPLDTAATLRQEVEAYLERTKDLWPLARHYVERLLAALEAAEREQAKRAGQSMSDGEQYSKQITRLRAALDVIAMRSYHGDPADYAAAVLADMEPQR